MRNMLAGGFAAPEGIVKGKRRRGRTSFERIPRKGGASIVLAAITKGGGVAPRRPRGGRFVSSHYWQ